MPDNFAQTLSGLKQKRAVGGQSGAHNMLLSSSEFAGGSPQQSAVSTGMIGGTPQDGQASALARLKQKALLASQNQNAAAVTDQTEQLFLPPNAVNQEEFNYNFQQQQQGFDESLAALTAGNAELLAKLKATQAAEQAAFAPYVPPPAPVRPEMGPIGPPPIPEKTPAEIEAEQLRVSEKNRLQELINSQTIMDYVIPSQPVAGIAGRGVLNRWQHDPGRLTYTGGDGGPNSAPAGFGLGNAPAGLLGSSPHG